MGRRNDTSRGKVVHMAVRLKIGGVYTPCGKIYFRPEQVSDDWANVTCKRCLKTRKGRVLE
jgi:hypothetical protein